MSAHYWIRPESRSSDSTPRWVARVVGAGLLLLGVLGFVPGVTTDYESMTWAGPESAAMLLGVFEVSVLHNVVHVLYGVIGLLASARDVPATWYLLVGGLGLAVLWIFGLVVGDGSSADVLPFNGAGDWLHLGLAAVMLATGGAAAARRGATAARRTARE